MRAKYKCYNLDVQILKLKTKFIGCNDSVEFINKLVNKREHRPVEIIHCEGKRDKGLKRKKEQILRKLFNNMKEFTSV